MKASSNQPYDLSTLHASLVEHGLIGRGAKLDLIFHEPAFPRRTRYRLWHYEVGTRQRTVCHLIVGKNLARAHAQAASFFHACPKLVCRPLLFLEQSNGLDHLCLEHFSGESLDDAVRHGRCTSALWLDCVRRAQHLLGLSRRPSNHDELEREISNLLGEACSFPGFSGIDSLILRELVEPVLLKASSAEPLALQWSNGDFVGRNLLINPHGDIRLIDYEFAAPTHFGRSDWLRLTEFSVLPPDLDPAAIEERRLAHQPWNEVHLWLHQLSQLRKAKLSGNVDRHIASTAGNIFKAIDRQVGGKTSKSKHSFLLTAVARQQDHIDSLFAERTTWAKSLEKELATAQHSFAALQKEFDTRTTWAKSLEAEVKKANSALAAQTKLADERTTWAQSLEKDLQATKTNFGKLTKEHAERTAWAQKLNTQLGTAAEENKRLQAGHAKAATWAKSLDAELQKARAAHAEQAKLVDERTAWAKALEKDLQATKTNFGKLTKEHAERTAWAQSLEKQQRVSQTHFEKLQAEHAKAATWAKSLEADLHKVQTDFTEQKLATQRVRALLDHLGAIIIDPEKLNYPLGSDGAARNADGATPAAIPAAAPDPEETELLEKCAGILADMHRDLAVKTASARAGAGAALDAQLRAEVAESEIRRLTTMLAEAQLHVDNLLRQAKHLQQGVNTLSEAKLDSEGTLRQCEQELSSTITGLQTTRQKLARYESVWICRLAARLAASIPDFRP